MPTLTDESHLTKKQVRYFGPKPIAGWGKDAKIKAEVRYDDECGNGHNTFAITADIYIPGRRDIEAGGCLHDEIAEHFPDLAPYIKWHLCSSDGPMHYIQNTIFLASDRDCWGRLKGEPYNFVTHIHFGQNPIKHKFGKRFTEFLKDAQPYDFEVIAVEHDKTAGETYNFKPKYTFGGFDARWHECPFDTEGEALDFLTALQTCEPIFEQFPTAWGEGKARELDAARHAAIWPDATDEDLTAPGLRDRLEARLPKLLEEFRAAVESLGFVW